MKTRMKATILDGRAVRDQILIELTEELRKLKVKPTLAIVLVGDANASTVYVREKEKAAQKIGANFRLIKKPVSLKRHEFEKIIVELNNDSGVKGIVVQKPLPVRLETAETDALIAPQKDIDGLNPASRFVPATARGIVELLKRSKIAITGQDVVMVGKSKLVGLPIALALLGQGATVTICHSRTRNLAAKTKSADILVVATGIPKLIRREMVKTGAVVIDVGISSELGTNKLTGDVDFENIKKIAGKITPVPGGVGPMTVAALMMNLVEATEK